MITFNDIFLLIILLAMSAFFSGAETALSSVSRFKVNLYDKQNKRGSHHLMYLKDNPHKTLAALLITQNGANIAASAIATKLALDAFGSSGVAIATGIMTFIILLFGEILPKNYSTTHAAAISLATAPFLYYVGKILQPIIFIFDFISNKIFRLKHAEPKITEEEIRNIVDIAKDEGGIDHDEKELIHKIFKFDDIDVDEIKIPRVDMQVIDINSTLYDALEMIKKSTHSRIPVIKDDKDTVVGIFYIKDALKELEDKKLDTPLSKLLRKPLIIPNTKKLDETLRLFQKRKQHMAILVDEHGGVTGLVTMEDILEEIVGEITDETDKVEPEITKIEKNMYKILGKTDVEDVNKKVGTKFKIEEEYDTLSGFILNEIGKIPKSGDIIELDKINITITKMDENRILEVILKKK